MLLGSLPSSLGKTNEIIHTIFRIDSLKKFCVFFGFQNEDEELEMLLDFVSKRIFEKLSLFHRFHSVPHVEKSSHFFSFKMETKWIKVQTVQSEHVFIHHGSWTKEEINMFFENELLNGRLDMNKPIWDCHVFPSKNEKGFGFAFVLRTHHAIADGLSLMHVISSIFEKENDDQDQDRNSNMKLIRSASTPKAFAASSNSMNLIERLRTNLRVGMDFLRSTTHLLISTTMEKDSVSSVFDPLKFEIQSKRSILFLDSIPKEKFDLARKRLATQLGVERIPANELLHAMISNAWEQTSSCASSSSSFSLTSTTTRFLVPFSTPIDSELLLKSDFRYELLPRNRIGFISAPIAKADSFIERLKISMKEWQAIKNSTAGSVSMLIGDFVMPHLPLSFKQELCLKLASSHSLVFSSVAGPTNMVDGPPFGVVAHGAMANAMPQLICAGSASHLTLTLTFNESKFPQTRKFEQFWKEELDQLFAA
jgi:hypothetical protein